MNERAREIFVKLASGKNSASETNPTAKLAALVKLARTGYAPAAVILKRRAMSCPEHKAALDGLLREAGAPTSAAPTPKPAAAPVVKKPAATVNEPLVVTASRDEFDAMNPADRNLFIRAGGKLTESPRVKNAFATYQQKRTAK